MIKYTLTAKTEPDKRDIGMIRFGGINKCLDKIGPPQLLGRKLRAKDVAVR